MNAALKLDPLLSTDLLYSASHPTKFRVRRSALEVCFWVR